MKIYPNSPYYDDFDETKKFYRILFKPGLPVQARELTQLQTLIQGQVERFGKNIFKEGSIVIPGAQTYDTAYKFVKLQTTYNSVNADDVIDNLVGSVIIGRTTGVRAKVINYAVATETDPPTIFVKYLNQGTSGTSTAFANDEIIDNQAVTISVRAATSSATGTGTAFSIGSGALFVKGSFVYFSEQTLIVSKYTQPTNTIIGFEITETVVTSDDDETLLDPAVGSSNYFAPGADRYQINLDLGTREFTPLSTDDPNFVEIVRVEDGEIIRQVLNSEYNILQDTLARRTYDESGDYVVRPFRLKLKEHLRTTNANSIVTLQDGFYTAAQGGNSDLFISVLTPGKAYVKGYEIDSIRTKYANVAKARDFVSVNNGTVATPFGNYVFVKNINSVPSTLANLPKIELYNQYNITPGTVNGTKVGTARVRHIEYYSGTIGSATAVYKVFLFDIQIDTGFTFADDAKQLYFNNTTIEDFTADIDPTLTTLTGTVTTLTTSNAITGSGTLFSSELEAGDYITINSETLRIMDVASNFSANVTPRPSANVSGRTYQLQTATVNDADKNVYVFPFPYSTIKSVDTTNTETIYSARRVYSRTLSSNAVSITAGTDEVFSGFSTDNYSLVVVSGGSAGTYVDLTGKVTRSGSPTGKTITFDLTGTGFTNEDVIITTTVQKTVSAADRKLKTLVTGQTVDYTSRADCENTIISLQKADVYRLANVRMSANAFGTAYSASNSIDITDRFELDNGQRSTFYDVGKINLKSGQPKPTGPIRINFDYFTHGTGDYFSVNSYGDIDYGNIGSITVGDTTYQLRDCLDFRSRIDDTGSNFTGTGSSVSEFPDFENDVITDYQYYLPRIDKLVLDRTGRVRVVNGVSSLSPQEPPTPDDAMALYVLKQNAYVFNLTNDIEVIPVDNKRYSMRDIGRIENRVKNLEYYTSLSLLEKDVQLYQVKDSLGFDRFKNGFLVDSFKGHGIGDSRNPDYSVAIDFSKNEARPLCDTKIVAVQEEATTTADRTANNYVKVGDIITLPYTEEAFITNVKSSKTANLNPFNMVTFTGTITLDPPSDIWYDQNRLPDVYRNVEGNYSTLVAEAQARGTFGTVWGNWRDVHYGNGGSELIQQREGIEYNVVETVDTSTNNDIVVSKSIIPKMRDASISFTATGLKPNTRLYAYFNGLSVDNFITLPATTSNATLIVNSIGNIGNVIITDSNGTASGTFLYSAGVFDLNTGTYKFRLLDVPNNDVANADVVSETLFTSSGELRNIQNEIISTRNAILDNRTVSDTRSIYVGAPPSSGGGEVEVYVPPQTRGPTFIDIIYEYAFGRTPDAEGYEYWSRVADERGITAATLQGATVSTEFIQPGGGINSSNDGLTPNIPASYNADAFKVYDFVNTIVGVGLNNMEDVNPSGALNVHQVNGATGELAVQLTSIQIATAVANPDYPGAYWSPTVSQAVNQVY